MPHSMSNCTKFLAPRGRRGHLRKRVHDDDIDWGMGERMKKILSPTVRSKLEILLRRHCLGHGGQTARKKSFRKKFFYNVKFMKFS